MTNGARDYTIEIRNEKDFYFGNCVRDRHYAKMDSGLAVGDKGTIKLQIGSRVCQEVTLTPAEARDIGRTLMNAAAGALPEIPKLLRDLQRRFDYFQAADEKAGHRPSDDGDDFVLRLNGFFTSAEIAEAEDKGWVEQLSHRVHGPQGVWRLTHQARVLIQQKAVIL